MQLQVIPSENYPSDELERLLAEIRNSGVKVTRGGIYGRRSLENLPPVLWLIASFAAGAVGTGFLNAIGADAWKALKKAIQQTNDRQGRSIAPTVTLELEFEDCQVVLWSISNADDTSAALDKALERLDQGEGREDLFYLQESDEWLTFDERLAFRIQRNRINSTATEID